MEAARREEAKRPPKPVAVAAATVRGKITVRAYLVNTFLKEHGVRETTRENYRNQSGHIISRIGSIPVAELTPQARPHAVAVPLRVDKGPA
jgi:hypothetical protein